jgi:hypothetical protein
MQGNICQKYVRHDFVIRTQSVYYEVYKLKTSGGIEPPEVFENLKKKVISYFFMVIFWKLEMSIIPCVSLSKLISMLSPTLETGSALDI